MNTAQDRVPVIEVPAHESLSAVIDDDGQLTYAELARSVRRLARQFLEGGIEPGALVRLTGDFTTLGVTSWLALASIRCIILPATPASAGSNVDTGPVEWEVRAQEGFPIVRCDAVEVTQHVRQLRALGRPGLILASSGTAGPKKLVLRDLLDLVRRARPASSRGPTLALLSFDHLGGINTMLQTFASGDAIVLPSRRSPQAVCDAIEKHRVAVLPASPTFLNLLLLSGDLENRDTSSLRLVTFGTEPMPEATLRRLEHALPHVLFVQTYGLTEIGVPRTRSRGDGSLWFRIDDAGFESRVLDDELFLRSDTAMLGYLDAHDPRSNDGWFATGDLVDVDGFWLRVRGRRSDVINVGGEKFWPTDVEAALLRLQGVRDAAVHSEPSALTGSIVVATVVLSTTEDASAFRRRMRRELAQALPRYMIPQRVVFRDSIAHTERLKRER